MTEPDVEGEVRDRATALLFRNTGLGQGIAIALATLLVASAQAPSASAAIAWWLTMMLVSGLRIAFAWRYRRCGKAARSEPRWRSGSIAGAAAAGLAWAAGIWIYMVNAPLAQQVYVAFVASGVVAGAVPILASVPVAFLAFFLPPVLVVMGATALQQSAPLLHVVSAMSLLFGISMMVSARYFADAVTGSVRTGIERLRLVRELESSRDAAQQADQAKTRFLATVSHELRTPLNGVLGLSQLLLSPGLSTSEREDCARTIHSSGTVLMAQLNDILDFSRIEAGRLQITAADFDPGRVCADVATIFQAQAQVRGVRLHAHWRGPAGARFRSDPVRIRQMLMNLVGNAVKFTPAGEIEVVAGLSDSPGGATLEFSVRDTGIGIDPGDQPRLFQPFSQIDSSDTRAYGGSGLGLSIVRLLAGLLGGGVGVESAPGRGSRFWFHVPALPAPAEVPAEPVESPTLAASTAPGRMVAHVLVAEDVVVNRKVVQGMLRKLGCTLHWVEDGAAAVEEITGRASDYDLVLMDCQMPRMDGYEATSRIRAWEREQGRSRMAIVALSAAAYPEDIERCLSAGMDDFLAKPLAIDSLSGVLDRWLAQPAAAELAPGGS